MNLRAARGSAGEARARRHLEAAGLRILAQNVRVRGGELDLVAEQGATVVFAEVRVRTNAAFGGALASVDAGKRRRLVLAAEQYLAANPALARRPCRFDVIAISGDEASAIEWHRDAFEAGG